jgi:hypothetical protein
VYSRLGSGIASVRVEAFTGAGGRILVDFYIGELSLILCSFLTLKRLEHVRKQLVDMF